MSPRVWRRAGIAALWWSGAERSLHACPVCFRFEDAAASAGAEIAVLVLAGVTVSVLIPCAVFALRLARRSGSVTSTAPQSDR